MEFKNEKDKEAFYSFFENNKYKISFKREIPNNIKGNKELNERIKLKCLIDSRNTLEKEINKILNKIITKNDLL